MEIGKFNLLKITRASDFGFYLTDNENQEVLLPKKYITNDQKIGDEIKVFIYTDSEDRPVATTEEPYAVVGQFAYLRCIGISQFGAFLDWGLPKDLFVPFSEQTMKLRESHGYIVYLYLDEKTNRVTASAKVGKFIDDYPPNFELGMPVELLIWQKTDLGYKAIVNNQYMGTLYENELFSKLYIGEEVNGYIKKVREDGKIDLYLHKPGHTKIKDNSSTVLDILKANGGFIKTTDRSPAEEIYDTFGMSKKNYKKAVGDLYKSRIIKIEDDGIRLIE